MARLEDLTRGASVKGVLPDTLVSVKLAKAIKYCLWLGLDAATLLDERQESEPVGMSSPGYIARTLLAHLSPRLNDLPGFHCQLRSEGL